MAQKVAAKDRAKVSSFIFEAYKFKEGEDTLSFYYAFDNGEEFCEHLEVPGLGQALRGPRRRLLEKIIFNLHLALGIGYYKAYCPKQIIIRSGKLNAEQAAFWNKLYTKGLGELFFRNRIDFRGLISFPAGKKIPSQPIRVKLTDRCLSGMGGGKDSCLAVEILKTTGHDISLISLNDSKVQKEASRVSGVPRLIIKRLIDKKLFEANANGAFNGHVPISSIFAWTAILAAAANDYRNVVFANEASASYGNLRWLGQEINHQYSKSLEFENDLRSYLTKFVTPELNYFSLLRQMTELKIVKLFSEHKKYFPVFSSCNRNFSLNKKMSGRWCGECPKCAFTFSQLAAFNDRSEMIKIFGRDLFADKNLLPIFQELWGEKGFKPFDCVGQAEEVRAAMSLASKKPEWQASAIIKYWKKYQNRNQENINELIASALRNKPEHNIPADYRPTILLGYGREGHFVHQYLRRLFPRFRFTIADKEKILTTDPLIKSVSGPRYLESIEKHETIIKAPGIAMRLPEIQSAINAGIELESATNIFLKSCGDRTIGVSGTKGKSTTASLIYSILKADKRDVRLIGNIGRDALKYLPDKGRTKRLYVYELSSYQLETSRHSPHVAVLINIFPDHLPYHRGFSNYARAKSNITRFQNQNDYFIFTPEYAQIAAAAKKSKATKINYRYACQIKDGHIFYGSEKIMPLKEVGLLGEHNLRNIQAAISAAKIYGAKNEAIRRALKSFRNLNHRLEYVGRFNGVDFYDDAISTTPESTLAAISVFSGRIGAMILGGEDRGYDFKVLAKKLARESIKAVALFPDSGAKIKRALENACRTSRRKPPKFLETKSMAEAVNFAAGLCETNQVCLLSTASPSYSVFKNFEEKGNLFQAAVKKYGRNKR